MLSLCTILNSSTSVQLITSSPFFANAMLADVLFFSLDFQLVRNYFKNK